MPSTFQLQILHASDLESGIPALTDAVNFSTVVNALRDDYANTLILSSGDNYIPGPFFSASSDPSLRSVLGREGVGRADIAIMNEIGFQASALGNHEFDLGTSTVADLIGSDRGYRGTQFPYLSANLDFTNDSNLSRFVVADGQAPQPNSIAQSTVITVGGERIGIVGATTPTLPSISSPGPGVVVTPSPFAGNPTPAQLDALAAEIQTSVDALTATGINKVVVLAHMQQLFIERELAKRLEDVDVIIAGGSHTLLPDSTDRLRPGDTAPADLSYPIIETNPTTGEQVLVVNTDANYTYVGRLVAEFDSAGRIDLSKLDPAINGAYATDEASVAALIATNTAAGGVTATPDPEVVQITDALRQVIVTKDSNLFGETTVFLNGTRGDVRTQETNLGNLTADANLFVAQQVDSSVVISLKNGGGIRDNIGAVEAAPGATDPNDVVKLPPLANPLAGKEEGEVSQLDIENSLRFNNGLSLVTVTAAQLKEILEHGVSGVRPGATPGAFPQVGGFEFSFDATRQARTATTAGERIRSVAINDADGNIVDVLVDNGQVVGDPNRTFRMVTLNFLAGGGDGYPFPAFATDRVDLFDPNAPRTGAATFAANGSEQDAFAEYLTQIGTFNQDDTAPANDLRIQNLGFRNDAVFRDAITGDSGNNTLNGTNKDDIILGGDGNDTLNGNGGNNQLYGGNGNDQINSGSGNDLIDGGSGNDTINAGAGDNTIFSGAGNDTVNTGSGNDQINVGEGTNRVNAGGGNNTITAGAGNDTITTGSGNDVINAGAGNNTIYALRGMNTIRTAEGDDVIYGGSQADTIESGAGKDLIYANGGNNIILAGAGADIIYSGAGNDRIDGGAGNDTIWLGGGQDVVVLASGNGVDTIHNFQLGQTQLGLSNNLTFNDLAITSGAGTTLIEIAATGEDLARLAVQVSLNASNFIPV